ncbi:hypothetical protein B0H10DRAFT_2208272 [Mycena sp. CBHHK59/15]|nr:hypothetical protein B0H10DRAFT_2208272 [Mycena sp. CBHHK59/15]
MWAKLSHALKPKQAHDDSDTNSHGDVMTSVFEQHPNLSVFHNTSEPPLLSPSPPPSPSKGSRRGMFKRQTKGHRDDDSLRAPSPMKLPIGLPKKVKSAFGTHEHDSQVSVAPASMSGAPRDVARRSSQDMLRPSPAQGKRRSSFNNLLQRPSIDGLRSSPEAIRSPSRAEEPENVQTKDPASPFEAKSGSVRSILRDRNTPGTGQNVRFFSRDAYKVLSPDQSVDTDYQSVATQPTAQTPAPPEETFLERLQRSGSTDSNASSVMPRFASSSKSTKPRPSVAEIFSPLGSTEHNVSSRSLPSAKSNTSDSQLMSQLPPIPAPDFTNFFDMSQELELPILPPPGLGFDVEMSMNDTETEGEGGPNAMTSTPYRDNGKGKGKEREADVPKENLAPIGVDETIFHAKEKVPRLPSALHDRSNSFSFGQTLFYSMAPAEPNQSSDSGVGEYPPYPSSAKSSPMSAKDCQPDSRAPSPGIKGRGRALSDTVFMSMLHSPPPKSPEADINDDSSSDLVVYSSPKATAAPEPDPFSAHATTYYTPQTLIPATPPQDCSGHARKVSKEEDLIFSLQTQLALQTELCGQYEADLRARDEMVEVLGKKLGEVEQEDRKKRNILKTWKKKVVELERACRYLEEEVEGSRHESMERSVMDEASSEALRMLHRQISGLEREKEAWKRMEDMLREEVGTLEALVRERSDDVMKLQETLWSRDESERELKQGIKEAKEQMEMMGNTSIGLIDEDELKKLVVAKEQRSEEERERHRVAEFGWEEEKEELMAAVENAKLENIGLVAELDNFKQQLKDHDEELGMLKSELEAQWDHTEKGAEKLEASEAAKHAVEMERDVLKADVAELEGKIANIEAEWADHENKQIDLETDIQELWDIKEALEKEHEELTEQLHEQEGLVETMKQNLQAREDRIVELGHERQYALDNVSRLEENIRRRDAEAAEYSQRNLQREAEAEALREQISKMKREHSGTLEAALQEAAGKNTEMDLLARNSEERVSDLKDEIERLRRQIHELQQESADKEVKIVQITKQRVQDKQDLQGLNIALDSKQQELELLKRRLGVRGTGGSTPVQPSKTAHQRRDSSVFTTPGMSRPPSVLSDSGTDGGREPKPSAETPASSARIPALGKSARLNSSTSSVTSSSKPVRTVNGAMGPPPLKPRSSLVGTPTPTPRVSSLSRSSSAKPTSSTPSIPAHRRVSSATLDQRMKMSRQTMSQSPAPSLSELDEKENVDVARGSNPQLLARIPTPA